MSRCIAVENAVALLGTNSPAGERVARKLMNWTQEWRSDTAAATTTAIAEQIGARVKQKSRLVGVKFGPAAAVTGAATNFFTLLIDKRTAALPGTPINLITYAADATPADDAAAFGSKDLYTTVYIAGGVAAGVDFDLEEGDVITVEVTKAAAGMTFPIASVQFEFEARD